MSGASESKEESASPWEQGSLLPESATVLPLQWVHPDHPATKTARGAVTAVRRRADVTEPFPVPGPGKQGARMMVITQSCDIIKAPGELPQVEVARVFYTDNPRTIAQAQNFGSARFFRVNDPAEPVAAVLDYGQRALLDKGFLAAVEPDDALLDALSEEQLQTLAAWLGRRYSRPAVPDEDYPVVTGPVREAWKELVESDPDTARRFNSEYAEWRYRREGDGSLTIYILALNDQPDDMTALEVSDFLTQTLEPVYPGPITVASDKRSYSTFTKADELSTEMINMEWVSRDEDAEDPAMPA